jgi:hypothetical protein
MRTSPAKFKCPVKYLSSEVSTWTFLPSRFFTACFICCFVIFIFFLFEDIVPVLTVCQILYAIWSWFAAFTVHSSSSLGISFTGTYSLLANSSSVLANSRLSTLYHPLRVPPETCISPSLPVISQVLAESISAK